MSDDPMTPAAFAALLNREEEILEPLRRLHALVSTPVFARRPDMVALARYMPLSRTTWDALLAIPEILEAHERRTWRDGEGPDWNGVRFVPREIGPARKLKRRL